LANSMRSYPPLDLEAQEVVLKLDGHLRLPFTISQGSEYPAVW
jgi:hypothetical protein